MKNKVFLVYPPISKQERYSSDIGASGGNQIPLGIFYLAAYLREQGRTVRVIDAEANNLTAEAIVERMIAFSADVVGISSTTVAFHRALELANIIKRYNSDIPIILGGPHISSNVQHALSYKEFDFGVIGEGEYALEELLQALEGQRPVEDVAGVAYRRDGRIVINSPRPRIGDLDALPFPAYDLIPDLKCYNPPPSNYKKLPVVNVITSRGCPNLCTFCDRNVFGSVLRQRSPENVVSEIEFLCRNYGVREIAFVDDTFTIGKGRIHKIFNTLKGKNIHVYWTCMSRVNTVDYELLKFMRDQGCWHISFGIESGNEKVLRRIKKNIKLEQVEKVIGWCASLGIKTKGFFMLGHPGETRETVNQTIELALRLPLDDVVATINTPIPGSQQYAEANQSGTLDDTDWSQFNYWRPVFVPSGMSKALLLEKHREFYRRFYVRPRIILRYALSFFSLGGLRRFRALVRSTFFLVKKPQ